MTSNLCNRCLEPVVLSEHGGFDFRDEESEEIYKETLLCQTCQDFAKENGREFQLEVPPKKSHNTSIENKIMTATQLIDELEYAIERNGGDDVEVLMAQQPKWPFEYTIEQAVMVADVDEDEEDDRVSPKNVKVYLGEGSQIGYLNENAHNELGW